MTMAIRFTFYLARQLTLMRHTAFPVLLQLTQYGEEGVRDTKGTLSLISFYTNLRVSWNS